ncbi:recombinase family protein [Roseinatronobacter sp.]|uniref:recombinase family protein n=1 Tax=Roseinatronobacter sp. TaxID=1945755 RepID=UPI0025F234C0|nr:recombinase family protein [Roseibaca sp.]
MVDARVVDHDGVYDPRHPNDRLLLGMKGSISEFELGVLRTRMVETARAKARRGELRYTPPNGYLWDRDAGVMFDPDLRIQEALLHKSCEVRGPPFAGRIHPTVSVTGMPSAV